MFRIQGPELGDDPGTIAELSRVYASTIFGSELTTAILAAAGACVVLWGVFLGIRYIIRVMRDFRR